VQSVCLSVCIATALSRAVSVNHVHSEEMLYGLFEIGSLENVVDWVGVCNGGSGPL
jgi:sulfur relay (sulfurtransferase) complex TusBCD TusD component (DsrE family)